jgi:hypothetical protein
MSDYTKDELINKIETILIKENSAYTVVGSAFDNPAILLKLVFDFKIEIIFDGCKGFLMEVYCESEFDEQLIQAQCDDTETETIAEAVCDLVVRKYEFEHAQENH